MHQPDTGPQTAPRYPVHATHTVVVTRWRWDRIAMLAAVVASVIGVVVYVAMRTGGETAIGSDGVPLILADPTPTRIRPEQPGGMPIANESRLILSTDRPAEPPTDVQQILPPPETPVWLLSPDPTVSGSAQGPTTASPAEPGDYEAVPVDNGLESIHPTAVSEIAEPAAGVAIADTPGSATEPPTLTAEPADLAALIELSDEAPTAESQTAPEPVAETEAPIGPDAVFAPVENGAWRVQLATVLRPEDAPAEWSRILRRNPDLLGALSPTVIEKERDGRILYGVQAAPLDEAGARGLCEALRSRSTDCLVVGP